jgi:hypothetical protein
MLHRIVENVLLVGVHLRRAPSPARAPAPAALRPLIEALEPERARHDALAIHFGHRYRSGFWSIYLLSAVAVLFAVLPLALGWDDSRHTLHPILGIWALGEVVIICTVAITYWLGHRRDWQGQWLEARTTAELIGYLPLLAPLVDFERPEEDPDWYLRVFDPGQHLRGNREVTELCRRHETKVRSQLAGAWKDPKFVADYAAWTAGTLEGQAHYHHGVAHRQHALRHRAHALSNALFGLTALGALLHLVLHTLYLSIVTTFFPALGASIHGAIAQSEAYRLETSSSRLEQDLRRAIARLEEAAAQGTEAVRESVRDALALILEEHQDWHMLVRPHALPLA